MKVVHVALCPTEASAKAGRPALTPELLAASGARYSRNNEGLENILGKIDPNNLDKSVDGIFKMIDYGHQSIADMAPVAMFMDDMSLWLAYHVWSLCPVAGGQESSTRYIGLSEDSLLAPEDLGIPQQDRAAWQALMAECFASYQKCLSVWDEMAVSDPTIMRIPREVAEDQSEKGQKKLARMRRNYAFDRARYYLPVAAKTNVMLVMSARAWVNLCQQLLSHPLPEPKKLGTLIAKELELCAPRLLRHATAKKYTEQGIESGFQHVRQLARNLPNPFVHETASQHPANAYLEVFPPRDANGQSIARSLDHHENRYAWFGEDIQRTAVRFGWEAVAIAEIRDLNRHRTGTKYCPLVPRGFYGAQDQIPADANRELRDNLQTGFKATVNGMEKLKAGDWSYIYWTVLGTQYPFEHTTTADKFIYEAELRTGLGAHYKYAEHLRESLALWYQKYPATKGKILEGSAEPE
ncbi:MAG: FAD-dependent thymidylate synthase [Verrucomicrobiales bacterium]|jgi:thymidylate synthase ThyX|nr:FAD-dependent thymidylate synthase [Verrucomicrobiales bacterium]